MVGMSVLFWFIFFLLGGGCIALIGYFIAARNRQIAADGGAPAKGERIGNEIYYSVGIWALGIGILFVLGYLAYFLLNRPG
ncbi:MAG: hypothetical protein KY468_00700 [Armatimonadetes bacterium]|nr:hypothetical protein [Armatimonadota bacterium]